MKILLINPATPAYILPDKEYVLSLALLSLAAVLPEHTVEILDMNVYHPWNMVDPKTETGKIIAEKVRSFNPSLIGITCLFSGQFSFVLACAETCKSVSQAKIVIGGMHPTIYPREILENTESIDYVVIGEGERQLVSIVDSLQNGIEDFSQLDGVAWKKNGVVQVNEKKTFIEDLNALPFPAYNLVDFSKYEHSTTSKWHNPKKHSFRMTVPIISSRSCPMHCNFCSMFLVMGPRIRMRTPQHMVDEIEMLYRNYGQKHFSFMDDNLSLNRKHVLGVCNEIIKRGLDIQFETPNGLMTASLNQEVMDALVSAGWIRGSIAIESGSDYIRKIMGKHLTNEKIFEIVELAKKYPQLFLKAFFIIGMPEETNETMQETYSMIEKIYRSVYVPFVTNLVPFPGTRVFDQARTDNLFIEEFDFDNLWRMDGFHYHNNEKFYLKPYQMELNQLAEWRKKFDQLLENQPLKDKHAQHQIV